MGVGVYVTCVTRQTMCWKLFICVLSIAVVDCYVVDIMSWNRLVWK